MTEPASTPARAATRPRLPDILERILASRRPRVEAARARISETELRRRAARRQPRDFEAALRRRPGAGFPAVIAELKRASPSAGQLRADFDVPTLAAGYERAGAAALSVLTEEDHFLGDLAYLEQARAATRLPILRKDFLFCPYQVWEAAAGGADAVLLIAAMLSDASLAELLAVAEEAGLAALCEVHDAGELERAIAAGADCIGVNNRDLHTFHVDPKRALKLAGALPERCLRVAESGLREGRDLAAMAGAGYDAVLVGEHFMRAVEPGRALAALRAEAPGFIKICGLTAPEEAAAAAAAGADAIGLVFARSPRQVNAVRGRAIADAVPPGVLRVGVFADLPAAEIARCAAACRLDAVQLHGNHSRAEAEAMAAGVPLWRALAMPAQGNELAAWAPHVQALLLDSAMGGGTGTPFDWSSVRAAAAAVPAATRVILAGGLNPENVGAAIRATGLRAVDVSSGVEQSPGHKDPVRIAAFVAAARAAFAATPRLDSPL